MFYLMRYTLQDFVSKESHYGHILTCPENRLAVVLQKQREMIGSRFRMLTLIIGGLDDRTIRDTV